MMGAQPPETMGPKNQKPIGMKSLINFERLIFGYAHPSKTKTLGGAQIMLIKRRCVH